MELLHPSGFMKNAWMALPVLVGALAGYLYYYYIGCVSGACPITSNPWSSTLYGAVMGALLIPWVKELAGRRKRKELEA
jgi:phage shock protein E